MLRPGSIRRILLLGLPAITEPNDCYLQNDTSFQLGFAYIAGKLRENGYCVCILDTFAEAPDKVRDTREDGWFEWGLNDNEIVGKIGDFQPDLIWMSIPYSCQYDLALYFGEVRKAHNPDLLLVAGGNHCSACPDLFRPIYLIS